MGTGIVHKHRIPAALHQEDQDVDWLDVIPVEIPPQPEHNFKQNIPTLPIQCEIDQSEIPPLEDDIADEEQSQDLQT